MTNFILFINLFNATIISSCCSLHNNKLGVQIQVKGWYLKDVTYKWLLSDHLPANCMYLDNDRKGIIIMLMW